MNRVQIVCSAGAILALSVGSASAARILFDMNAGSPLQRGDGNWWNNVGTYTTGTKVADAVDVDNHPTGVSYVITAGFYAAGSNGIGSSQISNYPSGAVGEAFEVLGTSASATLEHLTPGGLYNITFYGSYAKDTNNRPTDVTISGATQEYNATGTAQEGLTTFNSVQADASGNLAFTVSIPSTSTRAAFLNVVDIASVPEPVTGSLLLISGGLLAMRRRRK